MQEIVLLDLVGQGLRRGVFMCLGGLGCSGVDERQGRCVGVLEALRIGR